MAAIEGRPTLDEMWNVLQDELARTERLEQQNRQLQARLVAHRAENTPVLGRLGSLEGRRVSRASLLKGMGITAVGAAVAGTGLGLDAPSLALAAGNPRSSSSSPLKPSLATAPGYQYQMFSGLDFTPASAEQGWGLASLSSDAISAETLAPFGINLYDTVLDLPQGAVVHEVLFFVLNNSAQTMGVAFYQMDPSGNKVSTLSSATVPRSSSLQTISLTNLLTTIDNSQYYYVLDWLPDATGATQVLYGARVGYVPPAMGNITTVTPVRVLDTRTGTGGYTNPQPVGTILHAPLAGTNGIPFSATGIIGTLRAYAPSGNGYLTAYPGTGSPPIASNVNFTNGISIADQVTVGLAPEAGMSIYIGGEAGSSTHVVFDLSGYIV